MRYQTLLTGTLMAAGLLIACGATKAEDRDDAWRDMHYDRQDMRYDHRDLRHDYDRIGRMRADVAADQFRLQQDIRAGRSWAAADDARDLARDQRALQSQSRDIQRDRADLFYDRQGLRRDYYRGW